MAWIYLFLGGLFEIGWPLGFKLAHGSSGKILWITFSVLSMALSGLFLFMAQKTIPIGTAYVVWTGIGAVGTLLIGIFFFNDPASFWRLFSAFLVVAGIIGINTLLTVDSTVYQTLLKIIIGKVTSPELSNVNACA